MELFKAHQKRYTYIEPIWPILENNPQGITLDELVEQSNLDKQKMLNTIEQLSIEYRKASELLMADGIMLNLVELAHQGKKPQDTLKTKMANSWIFDKVMLYARVKELDWTEDVARQDMLLEIKELWLQKKGA